MATAGIVLCADDYGIAPGVGRAIRDLLGRGRLSATSCMVVSPDFAAEGPLLTPYIGRADIGLHLTLTQGRSLGRLMLAAYTRRLDREATAAEVERQVARFTQIVGRPPDFIDGHLHVHQLPGVRAGLIEFVLSLPAEGRPYIRNTRLRLRKLWKRRLPWLKAASIGVFGARMLAELRAAGLATNQGFAGVYNFRNWRRYPEYLPRFVQCLDNPNGILVVHPGNKTEWRRQELEALRGFTFPSGTPAGRSLLISFATSSVMS